MPVSTPSQPENASDSAAEILKRCHELGFALAGVTTADPAAHGDDLKGWLNTGKHGDMGWMERHVEQRVQPAAKLPGAQSVIVVADRYAGATSDPPHPGVGRIARYARGDDYHRVMKKRLHQLADEMATRFPGEEFVACVDTAPVLEREMTARAGIGYIGKNTMLIDPGVGSYLLLGEIITTLSLKPNRSPMPDHCGDCVRCLEACPTQALTPYSLDARRCISYLTIEHRAEIPIEFHRGIGDWIFGCDICQEVCPHNGDTEPTRNAERHPAYESRHDAFDLLAVLGWSEEDRREAFLRSSLKRAKLDMMKRNALIAAGNELRKGANSSLTNRLKELSNEAHESDLVRQTARQVLANLGVSAEKP